MNMKYWAFTIVGLVMGLAIYFIWDTGHGQTFSQSELQSQCLIILNKYISSHPNNIHCELVNGEFSGFPRGTQLYIYTGQDGNTLTINPDYNKVTLVDKNGNNLPLIFK